MVRGNVFRSAGAFVLGAAFLTVGGCYHEVTEESQMAWPVSTGPWAVDGVVLGTEIAACEEALGPPDRVLQSVRNETVWQWNRRTTVSFDTAGKAVEIAGRSLTDREGRLVIPSSASEEDVRHVLASAEEGKTYRPKGNGIISFGREHVGTYFVVRDDLGSYEVSFYRGQIGTILARAR